MPVHSVDSVVQSNFRYNVKRWNTKLGEEGPGDVPMIRHVIRAASNAPLMAASHQQIDQGTTQNNENRFNIPSSKVLAT